MKSLIIILLFISSISFAQNNYILQKITANSDINYEAFECLDFYSCQNDREKWLTITETFEPLKGKFTTFNFVKTFEGLSYDGSVNDGVKIFHDLLILKVNPETLEIIDGFQTTREWAEFPPISDLYRFSGENVILKNGLKISDLKFIIHEDYRKSDESDFLTDKSLIVLE